VGARRPGGEGRHAGAANPDSVRWRTADSGATEHAAALRDVSRVEVRAQRSQRTAVGGGIGRTVGSAWNAGVAAGQQAEVTRSPNAWRIVHPSPAD
jgi:hypothetical protein